MQLLCPECRSPLVVAGPTSVRCPLHPATFEVLFAGGPISSEGHPPPAPSSVANTNSSTDQVDAERWTGTGNGLADSTTCANHPNKDADYSCRQCGAGVCSTCAFDQDDGTVLCPTCAAGSSGMAVVYSEPAGPLEDGTVCATHPNSGAVMRCQRCNAGMCSTCDFTFPGGVHLCPTCATSPPGRATGKQRGLALASLGLAILATITIVLEFLAGMAGRDPNGPEIALLGIVTFVSMLVGMGLGLASFERHTKNSVMSWIGTIWNGLIIAVIILLNVGMLVTGG